MAGRVGRRRIAVGRGSGDRLRLQHTPPISRGCPQASAANDPRAIIADTALPVALGAVAGIALGLFRPLLDLGRIGDSGVAPYGQALLFAASIIGSTVLLAPFFFNFPVAGAPLGLTDYFTGTGKQHALGMLGGVLAGAAFLTGMLALGSPLNVGRLDYALSEGGPVLAVICGLLLWSEFKGAGERSRILSFVALILLAAGIALASGIPGLKMVCTPGPRDASKLVTIRV